MASAAAASLPWNPYTWRDNLNLARNFKEPTKIRVKSSAFVVYSQKKVKKIRKVILKEDIPNVGQSGQLLSVRAGYYRNFLLPYDKALLVTPMALKEMEMEKERIEAEKNRVKEEAEQLARILESVTLRVKRKPGRGTQFFGRVNSQDIVDIIKAQFERNFDKGIVTLPEIKEMGEYVAELKLHPEVNATVKVLVTAN